MAIFFLARVLMWTGIAMTCAATIMIILSILNGSNNGPRWFGLTGTARRTTARGRITEAPAANPCFSVCPPSATQVILSDATNEDPSAEHTLEKTYNINALDQSGDKVVLIDFAQRRTLKMN